MNNRKTKNKRGKNPRRIKVQTVILPATIKAKTTNDEGKEVEIVVPHPFAGEKRRIYHLNLIMPNKKAA